MIDETSIKGVEDRAFEAACKAFSLGPPGVVRRMQNIDSYPGEPDDRSEAYQPLPTSLRDERTALAEAINAYLETLDVVEPVMSGDKVVNSLRLSRHNRPWRQITVKTIRSGQARAFADTIDEYDVIFTGGSPSAMKGKEMPFATMRPFDRGMWKGVQSFPKKTIEEREAEHYTRIKALIRPLVAHSWDVDKTAGEPGRMGANELERFECTASSPFETTYRVVIRVPYMD